MTTISSHTSREMQLRRQTSFFPARPCTNLKVIPGKEVALQHQLLVCEMRTDVPPRSKHKFSPLFKVWKLKNLQTSNHFQVFNLHVSASAGGADAATKDIWNQIKTGLLKTTEEVCGTTQGSTPGVMKSGGGLSIAAKRKAFKAWHHTMAKRIARHVVHHAHQETNKEVYENIDPKSSEVYHLANQFRRENPDVVGDKTVTNDAGEMSMREVGLGPRRPV